MLLHGTSRVNEKGHLEIGEFDSVDLAERYGTPLYVYDEALIREQCQAYMRAFEQTGRPFQVAYASKAFCTMAVCKLIEQEGLALDVVSGGELHTAVKAGFPVERIHFHGNNKSIDELIYALEVGIGTFIVDNFYELEVLHALAVERNTVCRVMLRVTPGVEAHTHEYITTGQEDSKFGFNLEGGFALQAIERAAHMSNFHLLGVHAHIGSQIFETTGFRIMVERIAELSKAAAVQLGYELPIVNVGGGVGVRYHSEDQPIGIDEFVTKLVQVIEQEFTAHSLQVPEIWVEPGRSIVAAAGTTLYTIGSRKDIPGIRSYIAVDGGMTDNPRPALYQAVYETTIANKIGLPHDEIVSIAGKCCESGDMLIWDARLPEAEAGDILAVSCTGAYNYSMASNYNRVARPAVVFVKDGEVDVVVRRETYEDLIAYDLVPERLKTKNT